MSNDLTKLEPVRVSELFKNSKSSQKKPPSCEKLPEPVNIQVLRDSCSKASSSKRNCNASKITIPASRNSVRRALYSKATPPQQTPMRKNKIESSTWAVKVLAKKSPHIARKSLLPQPNSIVQRHIEKTNPEISRYSTIIEERLSAIHNTPEVVYQRASVIKSASSRRSISNEQIFVNKSFSIPTVNVHEDEKIETANNELEASIDDKENIPPPTVQSAEPSSETKMKSENMNLFLVGFCRSVMTRMERLENILEEVKAEQKNIICKIDAFKRSSSSIVKNSDKKRDSFAELEAELDIKPTFRTPKNSSLKKTPKNKEQRNNSKSDRPLREYLAMKASMNFLETPEPNGFRHSNNDNSLNNNTPSKNKALRRSISTKLFDELQDLYLDSPPKIA